MSNIYRFSLLLLVLSNFAKAQTISKEEFYQYELPNFTLYQDNYFITGADVDKKLTRMTSDIKYNVSFSQLLAKKSVFWDTYVYLSYTQKAFWDIYRQSSPFREINFNPAVSMAKPFWGKNGHLISVFEFKIQHESNGRDGKANRSWNRISGSYKTALTSRLQGELALWVPVKVSRDNKDITDYLGYGELTLDYDIIPKVINAELKVRNSLHGDFKGNIRGRVFLRIGKTTNQYFMLEYYNGYGESLINYNKRSNMFRIGYALKSPWDNLFKHERFRD